MEYELDTAPSHQKFTKPRTAGLAKRAKKLDIFMTAYNRDHANRNVRHPGSFTKPGSHNQGKR